MFYQDQLTDLPPYAKKPDVLNIFVSNTPSNIYVTIGNLEPTSNRLAILLTINASLSFCSSPPKLFQPNTDRCKIHNLVDQNIDMPQKHSRN